MLLKHKTIFECKNVLLTKLCCDLEAKCAIYKQNENGYYDDPADGIFISNNLNTTNLIRRLLKIDPKCKMASTTIPWINVAR